MPDELPIRHSARLIILDPSGRLLLFQYHDEHSDPFWATPGGELKGDEDYYMAAARELQEETGFRAVIGPVLRERDDIYAVARSQPARWLEQYFLVRCPSPSSPNRAGWTEEERASIKTWRWWNLAEMRQEKPSLFRPHWLPDLLENTLAEVKGLRDRGKTWHQFFEMTLEKQE